MVIDNAILRTNFPEKFTLSVWPACLRRVGDGNAKREPTLQPATASRTLRRVRAHLLFKAAVVQRVAPCEQCSGKQTIGGVIVEWQTLRSLALRFCR